MHTKVSVTCAFWEPNLSYLHGPDKNATALLSLSYMFFCDSEWLYRLYLNQSHLKEHVASMCVSYMCVSMFLGSYTQCFNKPDENHRYIKKPLNAFMIFRKEQRPIVMAEQKIRDSATVNAIVGQKVSVADLCVTQSAHGHFSSTFLVFKGVFLSIILIFSDQISWIAFCVSNK